MQDTKQAARKIVDVIDEIMLYRKAKEVLKEKVATLEKDVKSGKITKEAYSMEIATLLKGDSMDKWLSYYESYIASLFDDINANLDLLEDYFSGKELTTAGLKQLKLRKKDRNQLLSEMNIEEEFLQDFLNKRAKRKNDLAAPEYTLYKTSDLGKFANSIFEKFSTKLALTAPGFFAPLYSSLRMAGIKVLSKTYISLALLAMTAMFIFASLLASVLYKHTLLPVQIMRGILIGFFASIAMGGFMYFYPKGEASEKEKKMKSELPFAIIHMAAVAGSGAKPISIFKTLLTTDEYPLVQSEVKKIVNYVNLFGYDLPTAMKAVARTTPSLKFKDLLEGIVNTIETGGDLKEYLAAIAEEALNTYKLEHQKYVEVIATYSDIYTALFIAAPLLFFSTLAIIQTMGGKIGGVSVGVISAIGTYIVIPILNVGFMFFIDTVKPE